MCVKCYVVYVNKCVLLTPSQATSLTLLPSLSICACIISYTHKKLKYEIESGGGWGRGGRYVYMSMLMCVCDHFHWLVCVVLDYCHCCYFRNHIYNKRTWLFPLFLSHFRCAPLHSHPHSHAILPLSCVCALVRVAMYVTPFSPSG